MTLSAKSSLILGENKAGFRREGHNIYHKARLRLYEVRSILFLKQVTLTLLVYLDWREDTEHERGIIFRLP